MHVVIGTFAKWLVVDAETLSSHQTASRAFLALDKIEYRVPLYCLTYFELSKRSYAIVVSSDNDLETWKTSGSSSIFNWMQEYQVETWERLLSC